MESEFKLNHVRRKPERPFVRISHSEVFFIRMGSEQLVFGAVDGLIECLHRMEEAEPGRAFGAPAKGIITYFIHLSIWDFGRALLIEQ